MRIRADGEESRRGRWKSRWRGWVGRGCGQGLRVHGRPAGCACSRLWGPGRQGGREAGGLTHGGLLTVSQHSVHLLLGLQGRLSGWAGGASVCVYVCMWVRVRGGGARPQVNVRVWPSECQEAGGSPAWQARPGRRQLSPPCASCRGCEPAGPPSRSAQSPSSRDRPPGAGVCAGAAIIAGQQHQPGGVQASRFLVI